MKRDMELIRALAIIAAADGRTVDYQAEMMDQGGLWKIDETGLMTLTDAGKRFAKLAANPLVWAAARRRTGIGDRGHTSFEILLQVLEREHFEFTFGQLSAVESKAFAVLRKLDDAKEWAASGDKEALEAAATLYREMLTETHSLKVEISGGRASTKD